MLSGEQMLFLSTLLADTYADTNNIDHADVSDGCKEALNQNGFALLLK